MKYSHVSGVFLCVLVISVSLASLGCTASHEISKGDSLSDPVNTQKTVPVARAGMGKVMPQKMKPVTTAKPTPEQMQRREKFLADAMKSIPPEGSDDKTLSPYFFVFSDNPATDRLPLKTTRADVNIAGVIARTKITQEYRNEGKNVLEAIYIFPMSTRAAVYGMKMTIGDRVIEAVIKEKEQARKDYEQARQEGKTASLLEQQRPNVFQMNVANILPGDIVKVEVYYTELLVPEDSVYEYVYPTVVGPRYSNVKEENAPADEKWVKNPYTHAGEPSTFTFEMDLTINSGIPIAKVTCPSHKTGIEFTGKQSASLTILKDSKAGTKDVVVQYSLAGDSIEEGLLLYKGKTENFFLMMMEPPKKVTRKEIVPREYIFVLDVSGSMHGFPLDTAKKLLSDLFAQMNSHDYFNILFFSGGNFVLAGKSLPATPANKKKGLDAISRQRGGGGTELVPALKRALALPRKDGISTNIVVVTDGYVSVEKTAFEIIRNNLGVANLWSFGIGSSVNRFIIEGMARAGLGEPLIILSPQDAKEKAAKFKSYIESPVLTDIKVSYRGFDAYDVEPVAIPDLFAKRPIIVYGKYRGEPRGSVQVSGFTAGGPYKRSLAVNAKEQSPKNEALRYLWAREVIMQLDDMNKLAKTDERVKMVTNLGLKYNLMTQYTSFVAIDSRVRTNEKGETVKVPLPMPEGVSDYAVGTPAAAPPMMHGSAGFGRGGGGGKMKRASMNRRYALEEAEASLDEDRSVLKPAPGKMAMSNVSLSSVNTTGPLSADVVRKTIAGKLGVFRQCYKKAAGKKHKIKGAITFKLVIAANGKVTAVQVVSDGAKTRKLTDELVKKLHAITFPVVKKGVTMAEFTLKFTP